MKKLDSLDMISMSITEPKFYSFYRLVNTHLKLDIQVMARYTLNTMDIYHTLFCPVTTKIENTTEINLVSAYYLILNSHGLVVIGFG